MELIFVILFVVAYIALSVWVVGKVYPEPEGLENENEKKARMKKATPLSMTLAAIPIVAFIILITI